MLKVEVRSDQGGQMEGESRGSVEERRCGGGNGLGVRLRPGGLRMLKGVLYSGGVQGGWNWISGPVKEE